MIALDTNLMVYANRLESPFHARAREVIDQALAGSEPVGVPWPCVHEYIGTVTNRRIWAVPHRLDQAFASLESLLMAPQVRVLGEGLDHLATLRRLAEAGQVLGAQIHDARIAAICLSHSVRELWSCDRDFGRFPSLKVRNPLI